MILRKLGPQSDLTRCAGGRTCPDIFELKTGDYAIIGTDITEPGVGWLPPGTGCGPGERMVAIPRRTLVLARADIPRSM